MRYFFQHILLLNFTLLLLVGCSPTTEKESKGITAPQLKQLITETLNSKKGVNTPLNDLFKNVKDFANSYNKIEIDSQIINGTKYFSILLEHRIPVYNLFAVLNDTLNLLIKDQSLNGYLTLEWQKQDGHSYIFINEEFKSLDVFNLKRLSIYRYNGQNFGLAFRTITKIDSPKDSIIQTISFFSDTLIKTEISRPRFFKLKDFSDEFRFNKMNNTFASLKNVMDSFVVQEITDFNGEVSGDQIINIKSFNDILNPASISLLPNENEYQLTLDKEWRKIDNFSITMNLSKELKGNYYVNVKLGSNLAVVKIHETDSIENYVRKGFSKTVKKDFSVKTSEQIESGKMFYKFFEYSCGDKKYLLMLEGPKNTYPANADIYTKIIDSFLLNC